MASSDRPLPPSYLLPPVAGPNSQQEGISLSPSPPLPQSDARRSQPMPGCWSTVNKQSPSQTGGPGCWDCLGPALGTTLTQVRATGSEHSSYPWPTTGAFVSPPAREGGDSTTCPEEAQTEPSGLGRPDSCLHTGAPSSFPNTRCWPNTIHYGPGSPVPGWPGLYPLGSETVHRPAWESTTPPPHSDHSPSLTWKSYKATIFSCFNS